MTKKKVSVYIAGGFVVTLAILLLVFVFAIIAEFIHPRQIPLTITTPSAERAYDGTPLTAEEYTIKHGELAQGHILDVTYGDGQTKVGSCENSVIVYVVTEDGTDVTDYYKIDVIPGTLQVKPAALHVMSSTVAKDYDGRHLRGHGYEIIYGELPEGHTLEARFLQSLLYVGEIENTMQAVVKDANGLDVSDQFEIAYSFGRIKINPRHLTVSSGSAEKVFDGTPLVSGYCNIEEGTTVFGETLQCKSVGTQTLAGQSLNYIDVTVVDRDGNDMSDQYRIDYRLGTLIVTPRKIAIRSADATKPYDGKPLSSSGWEILAGRLCQGHEISVETYGQQISVGESDNEIVHVSIFDTSGGHKVDVTNSYQIECYYGILTVTMP